MPLTPRPHQYRSPALNDLLHYLDTGKVPWRVRVRVLARWWLDVVAVLLVVAEVLVWFAGP